MPSQAKMFYLPDMMANWPWHRVINPHYAAVKAESTAWLHSFKAFTPRSQYAFDKCNFALLVALTYPKASKKHLRSACDLMNLLFVIDEYTDVETEHVVQEMVDAIIDALKNPHKSRPRGETILGEITRQFWVSAIKIASSTSQRHFVESFIANLESIIQQAADRDKNTNHSIASYIEHRRENIGTRPVFAVLEFRLNLPDKVLHHPTIVKLTEYVSEIIFINNDVASYNKEQAVGDDRNNILTIAMQELNCDLDQAMDWVNEYSQSLQEKFLTGLKEVPSWGREFDHQVEEYLDGIANWARGKACWCFESGRYFGDKGAEVLRTRRVSLLKKVVPPVQNKALRRENVFVPLVEEMEMEG